MPEIAAARILIMATDGFEQSELKEPLRQLKQAGASVHVAAPKPGSITGWNEKDWGEQVPVDCTISEVDVAEYDALVLPGGQMNPDVLRMNEEAVALIRSFHDAGKVIAAICHAPWLLIEAGIVDGRRMTSWPSVKTDLLNAGADWSDQAVIADKGIVSSRKPEDIDAFVAKIIEAIEEGAHRRGADDSAMMNAGRAM